MHISTAKVEHMNLRTWKKGTGSKTSQRQHETQYKGTISPGEQASHTLEKKLLDKTELFCQKRARTYW